MDDLHRLFLIKNALERGAFVNTEQNRECLLRLIDADIERKRKARKGEGDEADNKS